MFALVGQCFGSYSNPVSPTIELPCERHIDRLEVVPRGTCVDQGSTETATSSCVTEAEAFRVQPRTCEGHTIPSQFRRAIRGGDAVGWSAESPVWVVSRSTAMGLADNRER